MQQFVIHGESAPSISLTQVLLDGVHYGTYQVGFGYGDCNSYGPGTQVLKQFHDTVTPSIALTKVTLDGSHNGTYQIGLGCLDLSAVLNDTGTIGKFLGSVLSFIGYSIRKLNSTFMVPFTGVLGTLGTFLKSTIRPISEPGIGFRSDFFANPSTIQTIQIFFSSLLNLTAVSTKRDRPIFAATLTLSGFFQRFKVKLLTAVISFVGAFTKRTRKIIAGLVQFTTSFSSGGKLFTANLNFTGVSTRLRGKIFSPVLSFIGVIKKFSPRTLPSSLSFTARIFHSIPTFIQSFTAALSFSGFFAAGRKFFKSNTATISFIGSITRFRAKILIATLSFVGTVRKSTLLSITATLSLIGTFTRFRPLLVLLTSSLSFVGAFIRGRLLKSTLSFIGAFNTFAPFVHLSSTLSFVGVVRKKSSRSFAATLSLIGNFIGIKPFLKVMTAALSFVGSFILGLLFRSVLSFVGTFRKFAPFIRLESVVSFVGDFSKKSSRSFTATILLTGNALTSRIIAFLTMPGILSFVGHHRKTAHKKLTGRLSWIGNLIRKFNSTFLVLLQSVLRFRPSFRRPFGNLVALFNVMITTVGQTILGVSREDHDSLSVLNTEQTIGNSPTILDTVNAPLGVLFVKNLDTHATVEVDSVSSFNKFPQLIPPGSGVYLAPDVASTIYAQSSVVASDVQIISLKRSLRLINLTSTINFTGSLTS